MANIWQIHCYIHYPLDILVLITFHNLGCRIDFPLIFNLSNLKEMLFFERVNSPFNHHSLARYYSKILFQYQLYLIFHNRHFPISHHQLYPNLLHLNFPVFLHPLSLIFLHQLSSSFYHFSLIFHQSIFVHYYPLL